LVSVFTRTLSPPKTAFFLFGPRGTGKSTWIGENFADAHVIDLLPPEVMLLYQRTPSAFREEVLALPRDRWIVVDEAQRAPKLLDEVHFLMERKGYKKFALTGSSARKLRRGAANLLAGRAVLRTLFPLTTREIGRSVSIDQLLRFGALPMSVTAEDDEAREDFLRAYVTVYLNEEIRAEALVRDLGSFARFLEIATLSAGQAANVSGIARDAQISRETARGYFDVLVDTLIGGWLPAYRPRAKIKEAASPKFYWFDPGVLRAAAGGLDQPLPADFDGVLFEHLILHELQSYMSYSGTKGSLGYWATPSGSEVDFIFWRGQRVVAIEAKHGRQYRPEYRKGLSALLERLNAESYIVYRGERELDVDGTRVMPVEAFLERLHAGLVL
jgi:predicted AAA+ superfamily ATPase